MACVSCEKYEPRITNLFRDLELKEKYERLIGFQLLIDCFICDGCNDKLQEVLDFQDNCIRVYKKNNPNFRQYEKANLQDLSSNEDRQDEFLILANDEQYSNEEQHESNNQYMVYELNDPKDMEIDEESKPITRKASNLKKERVQKCLIIQKPSQQQPQPEEEDEEDESLLMNDEDIFSNDEPNTSFKSPQEGRGKKKVRKSYTVQQKLEIIEFSERFTNREAARKFHLNESTIRCFRRQKDKLIEMNPEKSTNRHGTPYWPELEAKLKEWVEKQAVRPKMNDVREEAVNIAKSMGCEKFSGSNTYIFKFMQRNNIEAASPRPRKKIKVEPPMKQEVDADNDDN